MDNRTIEEVRENETKLIDEIKHLEKENQKLKKALKEGVIATCETCEDFGICPHSYREYDYKNEVKNLKNQQKEFIEWLENKMKETHYTMFEFQAYRLVFEKYKEIVGVKDGEN